MNSTMMQVEYQDAVVIVRFNRDVTNAINLEFVLKLTEILKKTKNDPDTYALVLSSSNEKFFSIGFDIPQLFTLTKDDFKIFYQAFNRVCLDLYTMPKPTIAAITGHAVAGGCIIAICCDCRYIAEGKKKMGLNETKLGVPVPYPADRILHQIVGFQNAREIIDTGEFYLPDMLFKMGVVDEVVPLDELEAKVIAKARFFSSVPQNAFALIKKNRVETVEAQILSKLKEKEIAFLNCWYADETRKRLKEAMKKF